MTARRPTAIDIVEVGPRDGLQNDSRHLSTEAKVEMIAKLAGAGLRRIEAASFVNPKRVPQMADAEAVLARVVDLPGVSVSGLVLNGRGFERALAAGLREISFVAVATDTMAARNQGTTARGLVETWAGIAKRAEAEGLFRSVTIAVAFGCPFEGEVPLARVIEIARALAESGADEISLADTIGVATPLAVEERFAALSEAVPGLPMRAHFHNTRNTGYANADAALRSGVTVLDASLGGLGGCPFAPGATGNIATEDLVSMLERDRVATGVSLELLRDATLWLEGEMGRRLPAHGAHVSPWPRVLAA
ncbi:hydroxymethylglutaryl-CoA lyase [Methylobacterium nonmethylotrophicum]|uniref:Hydroxymethylglutaryl-CoA lyase n=1 Tax=Methylobacterium nonmethylotrophicum TaxID=1141884 RepID=A0A4Z0NWI7_9HYPH|nr:hydroxymethylglutaryl-CoA lyase [Methylobacterium nonmethylotrophicum]TGE01629.1 hydroxymethylglutaryl-CoA lyase [Methylobacterium nonmethylotrophicum]